MSLRKHCGSTTESKEYNMCLLGLGVWLYFWKGSGKEHGQYRMSILIKLISFNYCCLSVAMVEEFKVWNGPRNDKFVWVNFLRKLKLKLKRHVFIWGVV